MKKSKQKNIKRRSKQKNIKRSKKKNSFGDSYPEEAHTEYVKDVVPIYHDDDAYQKARKQELIDAQNERIFKTEIDNFMKNDEKSENKNSTNQIKEFISEFYKNDKIYEFLREIEKNCNSKDSDRYYVKDPKIRTRAANKWIITELLKFYKNYKDIPKEKPYLKSNGVKIKESNYNKTIEGRSHSFEGGKVGQTYTLAYNEDDEVKQNRILNFLKRNPSVEIDFKLLKKIKENENVSEYYVFLYEHKNNFENDEAFEYAENQKDKQIQDKIKSYIIGVFYMNSKTKLEKLKEIVESFNG